MKQVLLIASGVVLGGVILLILVSLYWQHQHFEAEVARCVPQLRAGTAIVEQKSIEQVNYAAIRQDCISLIRSGRF